MNKTKIFVKKQNKFGSVIFVFYICIVNRGNRHTPKFNNIVSYRTHKKQSNMKKSFQFAKFEALQSQLTKLEGKVFHTNLAQGEILKADLEIFKSDEYKAECGKSYPTIESFIVDNYKVQRSWAYKLIRAVCVPQDTINAYIESEEGTPTISKLLKYAKPTEAEGSEAEAEGSEAESEPKAKPQTFKASCSAKGDIKISGNISKEFATMLIEEIKKAIK